MGLYENWSFIGITNIQKCRQMFLLKRSYMICGLSSQWSSNTNFTVLPNSTTFQNNYFYHVHDGPFIYSIVYRMIISALRIICKKIYYNFSFCRINILQEWAMAECCYHKDIFSPRNYWRLQNKGYRWTVTKCLWYSSWLWLCSWGAIHTVYKTQPPVWARTNTGQIKGMERRKREVYIW